MPFRRPSIGLKEKVIIVGSEKCLGRPNETILQASGIRVKVFGESKLALEIISLQWNGTLLIGSDIPAMGGWRLLKKVKQIDPDLPVVMILDQGDISLVVKAMRMGAYDVLQKPFSNQDVQKIIIGALEKRRLVLENRKLQLETGAKEQPELFIQGRSGRMECLSETIRKAGEVDAEVVLVGETGTGKKMIARSLHEQSPRRHNNFVAINCSSIPEDILERDLFGHEPGAFQGAPHLRAGKLECADGGTVYLDKIDCLSMRLQDRLLQILQEGTIEKPGSIEPKPIDIRVIASTKGDLKNACLEGRFREGLFYRLNVIQIVLPPLREHLEDIPLLFQHFVLQACTKYQRPAPLMTDKILSQLLSRDWPGNVRELKNVAERFGLGFGIDLQNPINHEESIRPDKQNFKHKKTLVEKMDAFEKNLIAQELARTNGNVKTTYLTLGLPRKTFYDKMNKHGLKRKDFLAPGNSPNNISVLHK